MPDQYTLDLQSRRVKLAEQREARFQRSADARQSGPGAARRVASAPSRAASATTSYSGNRVLAAELLVGFVIVAIRVVADYEGTGLTIGPHPMALRREEMSLRGALRASDLGQQGILFGLRHGGGCRAETSKP